MEANMDTSVKANKEIATAFIIFRSMEGMYRALHAFNPKPKSTITALFSNFLPCLKPDIKE